MQDEKLVTSLVEPVTLRWEREALVILFSVTVTMGGAVGS